MLFFCNFMHLSDCFVKQKCNFYSDNIMQRLYPVHALSAVFYFLNLNLIHYFKYLFLLSYTIISTRSFLQSEWHDTLVYIKPLRPELAFSGLYVTQLSSVPRIALDFYTVIFLSYFFFFFTLERRSDKNLSIRLILCNYFEALKEFYEVNT